MLLEINLISAEKYLNESSLQNSIATLEQSWLLVVAWKIQMTKTSWWLLLWSEGNHWKCSCTQYSCHCRWLQRPGRTRLCFIHLQTTSQNGEKLVDYSEEFWLLITNTRFMKHTNRLWSFQHLNEFRSQIDYILVRKKWKNSVWDTLSYSWNLSVSSDHRFVSIYTTLSLL